MITTAADVSRAASGLPLGATMLADGAGCAINVWAPAARLVEVRLHATGETVPLTPCDRGYHNAVLGHAAPGTRYSLRLDGGPDRPDPASRSQPEGPHGPSEIVSPEFAWKAAAWHGLPLDRYVIYELHVGTFTPGGTFDAIIPHLDSLRDFGVTAVELMPVAQFPGGRNWGYDGVGLFAAQNTYGGPTSLRRLVDASHERGLAVILDVVYNHLGPEGNYLAEFGPYFTDRYTTPWGAALNFDGECSDEVRRFFVENALYWITDCRIDALRLDAIHAIVDPSPVPFIQDLCAAVHRRANELGRTVHCIAESAANDARLITPADQNGYGADAQWNDDFHHALRTTLTDERSGYYAGYDGLRHLRKALEHGFVFTGEHEPFRGRRHGSPSRHIPAERFVVFAQNHDQVGNRMLGERLAELVPFELLHVAAAATILSPFIPLLFMGEEYAEPAPFLYFVSHTDPALVNAVRRGRADEFSAFRWQGTTPDPQSEETFARSRLDLSLRAQGRHAALLAFYTELLRLRREHPALSHPSKETLEVTADEPARTLVMHRWTPPDPAGAGPAAAAVLLNFCRRGRDAEPSRVRLPRGRWDRVLDSSEGRFGASAPGGVRTPGRIQSDGATEVPLPPATVAVYSREDA